MVDLHLVPLETGKLGKELQQWAERAVHLAPAYKAVYADFRRLETETFDKEGPGWKPLAASTLARKRARGLPEKILHATETLRKSLTVDGAAGAIDRDEGGSLFVGSDIPYGHWHQTGGTTPGRPPERPPVRITEADKVRWLLIVARYLASGVVLAPGLSTGRAPSGPGGL
jgi:phage gpG-like protein